MISKKIDGAIEAEKYCLNTYGSGWIVFFKPLEVFANFKSVLTTDRDYLLTSFGYHEASLDLDAYYDIIRESLYKKDGHFLLDEGLAFIEFYKIILLFDEATGDAPDDNEGFRNFCLNHPLWPRLEEQARNTLELFKKNKNIRTLSS